MSQFAVAFRTLDAAPGAPVRALDLVGELDAHTAPDFEAALEASLADGHARIVVSGAELAYVSSAGLGMFMAYLEPTREAGGDLKVAALREDVLEVFDLLGFPLLFDIQPTVDAAVARYAAGAVGPDPA